MGVEMPFPLPNPDGCVNHGLTCPIKKGEPLDYIATLPVLKAYPKVSEFTHYWNIIQKKSCLSVIHFDFILLKLSQG